MSSYTSIPFNYYTVCTCIPISITAVNSVVQECPPPLLPGPHTATLVAGSTTRITGSYVDNNSTVECFWSGPNATLSEATTSDLSSTNTRSSSRSTTIREAAACSSDMTEFCFTLTVAVLEEGEGRVVCNITCGGNSSNSSGTLIYDIISKLISMDYSRE